MKKNYNLKICIGIFLSCLMIAFAFNLNAQTVTLNSVLSGKVTSANVLTNGDATNIGSAADRGYLKFDLTAIPVGATVTSATVKVVAIAPSASSTSTANKLTTTTLDAATAGAGFYAALNTATSAATGSFAFATLPNTFNLNLNAAGITALNTALGTGQITYGLIRGSTFIYTFAGYNNATISNQPQLTVTYGFPCSGTPAVGTASGPLSVCSGSNFNLVLSSSGLTGITYQWQSSPDGTTYSNVAGTSATFTTSQTSSTFYQCVITCTSSGLSAISNAINVSMSAATYATIPYLETFEASWINGCATKDVVSNSWRNNPITGNNSWRRQNEGATAAWSFLVDVFALVTPSGSTGAASFHSYGAAAGLIGTYDLYVDLSTTSAVSLGFNYQNATGADILEVLLSTDGGVTFGPVLGTYTTGAWAAQTLNLGVVGSATSVIRFKASSDYGNDDIGIDNVVVALTPNCPPPSALTASAITTTSANLVWTCTSCVGSFALEYGPTGFAPGTGTIVNPAVSPVAVSGLTAGTTYQYYVIQDCSGTGAGFSPAAGPVSFTTKMLGDDVCSSIGLTFGSSGPYDNTTATNEIGEPIPLAGGCNTQINWCDFSSAADNSMWFSFVAPASGRVNIQAPGFDTQLALWSAPNCASILTGGATLLAANDDAAGAPSYSSILTEVNCLTPGTTYYLQLDGYSGTVGSTVIILTDLGVVNASFTGLSSSYCIGAASATLTPATAGGVFSGTGIFGSSFNASTAGVGSYSVSYTVNGCYTATQSVTVNALPTVTAASTGSIVCSGTSVTLTGGGATSYAWDNSVIDATAFVPSGSLSYNVVGTDANGCTNTASVSVTVNALPTVTATSTGSIVCSGTSITLTGGGATTYAWDNSVVDGTAFVPTGSLSYNVVGTDINGCTNTASVSVTVNAVPTVTATSTGSIVCSGTSVTLTGGGATTYAWDNSVVDGTAFVPSGSLSYNVIGTDANGCTNTASVSVTVNTLPTVTAASTSSSVCSGTAVTLTGGGATTYVWDNSVIDGTAFVPSVSSSYNVVGTDVNGCTNTASVTVSVNDLPTVTASSTGSTVCSGTAVTLTGGGATTYVWDNSVVDGTAFVPSVSSSYDVVGTDANGCTNTASVTVSVNDLPIVTASSTSSTVCSGTAVTLTGGGATTYVWDNSVVDGTAFVPSVSSSYEVVGTDVNGCTNTASVTVSVNDLPMIMASSTPVLCNGGTSSVTITGMDGTPSYTGEGTFTQSAGTVAYSITDANGCDASTSVTISEPALISSTQTLTVCAGEVVLVGSNTYNTTGIFNDVLTSAFGCDSTVTTDLTVNAALDLTTSVSGNVITATSATATYQWIDCDNGSVIIPGETGQTYTALSSGNFAVIITEAGSCSDTSACVNVSVTGIDSNFEQIVSVYPNPSNGLFTLSINNVVANQIVISILDIQGKIVFAETDKNISADYKKQINLSDLAKGIYYVKINIGSELKTQKLIVQ